MIKLRNSIYPDNIKGFYINI